MNTTDILGFVAGAITTLSFIPQVVRVLKLKSAREISLPFTWLFLAGIGCWLVYGSVSHLLPVIIWNAVTAVLGLVLLYAKLRYGKEEKVSR